MALNSIYAPQDLSLHETKLTGLFETVEVGGKKILRPSHQGDAENDLMTRTILGPSATPTFAAAKDSSAATFTIHKSDLEGTIKKIIVQLPLTPSASTAGYWAGAIKNVIYKLPGNVKLLAVNPIPLMIYHTMNTTDDDLVKNAGPKGFGAAWANLTITAETYFYIDITGPLKAMRLNNCYLDGDIVVEFNLTKYTEFMDQTSTQTLTLGSDFKLIVDWVKVDDEQKRLYSEAYGKGIDINYPEIVEVNPLTITGASEKSDKMGLTAGLTAGLILAASYPAEDVQAAAFDYSAIAKFRITDTAGSSIGFTNADVYYNSNLYWSEYANMFPSSFCFKKNIYVVPLQCGNIHKVLCDGSYQGGWTATSSDNIKITSVANATVLNIYQIMYKKLHVQNGVFVENRNAL